MDGKRFVGYVLIFSEKAVTGLKSKAPVLHPVQTVLMHFTY